MQLMNAIVETRHKNKRHMQYGGLQRRWFIAPDKQMCVSSNLLGGQLPPPPTRISRAHGCAVIWAIRQLGDRRPGDKISGRSQC